MKDEKTGLDVASVGDAEGVAALVGLDAPDTIGEALRAVQAHFAGEDDPVFADLCDLVNRAAEEHGRRAAVGGNFTPERIREARERCAIPELTPAPWIVRDDCGGRGVDRGDRDNIGSDRFILNEGANGSYADLAFAAHAREDLPAVLAEIERQAREIADGEAAFADMKDAQAKHLAEIERLTAELAAHRALNGDLTKRLALCINDEPTGVYQEGLAAGRRESLAARTPADASLEARAEIAAGCFYRGEALEFMLGDEQARSMWQAVVRAVDASRPAAPVIDAEDLWADYRTERGGCDASHRLAFLAGVAAGRRTADASRPGLTIKLDAFDPTPASPGYHRSVRMADGGAIESVSVKVDSAGCVIVETTRRPGLTEVPGVVFDVLDKLHTFVAPFADAPHDEAAHLAETPCLACIAETMSLEIEGAETECHAAEKVRPGLAEEQAPAPAAMLAACDDERFGGFGQGFVSGVLAERARRRASVEADKQAYIADAKTGNPYAEPCDPESCHGCANEALLRASRGETGPARPDWQPCACGAAVSRGEDHPTGPGHDVNWSVKPSGLTSIMADAQRRPSEPPDPEPEEKRTTRTLAWHVRPDTIRALDEHGRVIAATYPESQEADSRWMVWWQRQPTRRKDHAAPHYRLSKSSALHAIREGLAWWGCDVSRLDVPPPDPRATLHDGDPQKSGGNEQ